jgi:hypothetical protein
MRINARLDEEIARKFKALQQLTGAKTTDLVKEAIALYYDTRVRADRGRAAKLLAQSGFIGCGSAAPDLSTRYKEVLTESLGEKA